MEDNFCRARLESTRISKYNSKTSKNITAKEFIEEYIKNEDYPFSLKKAAFEYRNAQKGIITYCYSDDTISKITQDEIESIYKHIKENCVKQFIAFFESYKRKIDEGYNQEFVDNSFEDLKIAYYTYRKSNNPGWNLTLKQINESEMANLYNILTNTKSPKGNEVILK